jgi:hypothetical protein
MRSVLKWIGIVLAVLVVLLILAATWIFLTTESRITRIYDVVSTSFKVPTHWKAETTAGSREMCKRMPGPISRVSYEDDPLIGRRFLT